MDRKCSHKSDPRIEAFLQQCTEGLKGDPELRLQTQRELWSHLESHLAESAAEEDLVGAALKAMGSSLEIAGPLQKENARRMKTRAFIKLGVRTLVLPAALMVTVWLMWVAADKALALRVITNERARNPFAQKLSGLSDVDRLILYGDESQENPVARHRATWDAFPADPVYFVNYVLRATNERIPVESIPGFGQAESIDPGNALYPYLTASFASRQGIKVEHDEGGLRATVVDSEAAEQFRSALHAASESPKFTTYREELVLRRQEILARSGLASVEKREQQYAVTSDVMTKVQLSGSRQMMKAAMGYAKILKDEGRQAEASTLLEDSLALYGALTQDARNTLIDWVMIMALANLIESEFPDVAEGLPLDLSVHEHFAKIEMASKAITRHLDDQPEIAFLGEAERHGGYMAVQSSDMVTGLVWNPDIRFDLEPGRLLDYILLERVSLVSFLGLVLLAAGFCYAWYLWNRWRSSTVTASHSAIPLLLVPTLKEIVTVLVFGVAVPIAVYLIYSRWTALSGRDLNATTQFWRFVSEQIVLWIAMIFVSGYFARRIVRSRFRSLGLSSEENMPFYRATLMRSVVPVFAAVALTTALIAHPYLKIREAQFVRADTMMSIDPNGGYSQFESKMVHAIRETIVGG